MKRSIIKFLATLAALMLLPSADAEITARVYPGYQFNESERPTVSTLNLLGTPTIEITGTLGGTNVALGAGTVSGTMLMDSVAGEGLEYDGESPRGLRIAAAAAGLGLGGGGGAALSNKVDGVRLVITNDTITLSAPTNTLVGGGASNLFSLSSHFDTTNSVLALKQFTSFEYTISSDVVLNTNHSLGVTPSQLRCVLVCKVDNAGYVIGDEVDAAGVFNSATGVPSFTWGGSATNVFLAAQFGTLAVKNKSNGSNADLTLNRWRAKVYARP